MSKQNPVLSVRVKQETLDKLDEIVRLLTLGREPGSKPVSYSEAVSIIIHAHYESLKKKWPFTNCPTGITSHLAVDVRPAKDALSAPKWPTRKHVSDEIRWSHKWSHP